MSERSLRGFILLCLFVNAIVGSPRLRGTWDEDEQTRNPRHASCPSCRRERPDTLVSWSAPAARGYYGHEPETSPRQAGQLFRSNPTFQSLYDSPFNNAYSYTHDRAIRSRGVPPVTKPTATSKREDPFTIGRDLDSDLATSQTASIHDINNPTSPYHSHFPVPRTPSRTQYRRSNFYDLVKSQSDLIPSSKLLTADYGLTSSEPSFGDLRRHQAMLVNNEDDSRSFGPRKEFTMSQSDLIPSNQLYADYAFVNRAPSFQGNRRSGSSVLVPNEEDLRNFGARKQFTIGSKSDDYFDDSLGDIDSINELSAFGTSRRSLNPLTGNEDRSNFNNELSFNNLRRPSPSINREDLKNFGLNPRSDRYLSDSFERSNPMSESDQYSRIELKQFPKPGSSQFFKAGPRQYTNVQTSQFSRIEPGQSIRAEPKQFSRTGPNQYSHVRPSQFFKFEPSRSAGAEPSQYLRIQANEYSVAGDSRLSHEREPEKVTRPQFVESEDSNRPVYAPEVKHNSHNLPEELNVFRMTHNKVGKDEVEVVNSSRWEKQSNERKEDQASYEIDENSEQVGTEMDDYQNNEQLKSRGVVQQQEIKRKGDAVGKGSNSRDQSGFSGNRSLGEDSSNSRLERSKNEDEKNTTKTVGNV